MTDFQEIHPPRIVVGICSARKMTARRDAVRDTWWRKGNPNINCVFFVGEGGPPLSEPDTVELPCPDGYDQLPQKVIEFFKYCLANLDFHFLFKCDDDTYLVQDRLHDLLALGAELVGSEEMNRRRSPSGGAGYLLSRRIVQAIALQEGLPLNGPEDIIIGEAAVRLGATWCGTSRLWATANRFPTPDNDVVTSHWCSPDRLRFIHAGLYETPWVVYACHTIWRDEIYLYPGGFFKRHLTACSGKWATAAGDRIILDWFDWGREVLVPTDDVKLKHRQYRCVPESEAILHHESS